MVKTKKINWEKGGIRFMASPEWLRERQKVQCSENDIVVGIIHILVENEGTDEERLVCEAWVQQGDSEGVVAKGVYRPSTGYWYFKKMDDFWAVLKIAGALVGRRFLKHLNLPL